MSEPAPDQPRQPAPDHQEARTQPARPAGRNRVGIGLGLLGIGLVAWVTLSQWGGVSHGHPAYGLSLAATLAVSVLIGLPARRLRSRRGGWRRALRVVGALVWVGWLALLAWATPHSAVEPALTAMKSDAQVTVVETATRITFTPTGEVSGTAVFFQPGALVDARAYAAVLRPLAAAGHQVVVTKQPFGIAFLAVNDFAAVQSENPQRSAWVLAGLRLVGR